MRVLHVLDVSEPMVSGYSSRSKGIVDHQRKIGLDPLVVTSARMKSGVDKEHLNGTPYFRTTFPAGYRPGMLSALPLGREFEEMRLLRGRIGEILNEVKVDLIHAHSPPLWGLAALAAARPRGIPLVYEVRAFWEDAAVENGTTREGSARYRMTRLLENYVLRRADAVTVICQGLKDDLIRRGFPEEKITVVPNGVDLLRFQPAEKDPELIRRYGLQGKVVFGFIGSFFAFEGIHLMLEAACRLQRDPRFRLLLLGGGREAERVRRRVAELGLEQAVLYPGVVPSDQVRSYYSITDVLVYPRLRKRLTDLVTPLKPLEAMAMEKTVLASDVGGLKELSTEPDSILFFNAGDVESLVKASRVLIEDPSLRKSLGEKGRQDVLRNRDWARLIRGYLNVYEPVLGGGSRVVPEA